MGENADVNMQNSSLAMPVKKVDIGLVSLLSSDIGFIWSRRLVPGTITLRLGVVRHLAYEAADCGLLSLASLRNLLSS